LANFAFPSKEQTMADVTEHEAEQIDQANMSARTVREALNTCRPTVKARLS
jgi:hypothetical protein